MGSVISLPAHAPHDEGAERANFRASAEYKAASQFLAALWAADAQGTLAHVHLIGELLPEKGFRHYHVRTVHDAVARAFEVSSRGHEAYFACSAFAAFNDMGGKGNRTGENAVGAHCLWLDLDCGPEKAYADKPSAAAALRDFCKSAGLPKPSFIVDSGNGLHCYWHFERFIEKDRWRSLAKSLKDLTGARGLKTDPSRTADIASVLRVPGTKNWKDSEDPKPVILASAEAGRDFDGVAAALARKGPDRAAGALAGDRPQAADYPHSSAQKIISKCPTLAHVAEVGGAVSEPLWRGMLGVVKYTTEGEALCHEWSKGDPRYKPQETQKKIEGWTTGPTLCSTFRGISDAQCQRCPLKCRSPIQLGHADDADPMKAAMQELDLRYFVAKIGGDVLVFDEEDDNVLTGAMNFTAFQHLHAGRRIGTKPVAAAWLNSSGRRTYGSLVFDPSGNCDEGNYNTWRGLAVEPKQGQCGKILAHIRDIWCSGNAAQFEYVVKWMALLVQKPWIKPEVALVLKSRQGTGKTIMIEMLLKIFGIHGFTTAQKEQVAGRFSGHLFDKVLIVLEEAFFAGDPAAVAAAKALITNPSFGYEAKGKDAISAPSFAHVIMLTNNAWAVPAEEDARRWMILDMSEVRMGDHAYFRDLADEMDNGGTEAFLDYLMKVDLSRFNSRALPKTDALQAQRVETLERTNPVAAILLHVLSEGEFLVEGGAVLWTAEISAADLQESYTLATKGVRNAPAYHVAAKKMRELLPAGALTKIRKAHGGDRFFHHRLPDLAEAREHFKNVTGIDPCAH